MKVVLGENWAVLRGTLFALAGATCFSVAVCSADPLVSYEWPLRVPSLTIAAPATFSFADGFDRVEMVAPTFLADNQTTARDEVTLPPITVKAQRVAPVSVSETPGEDLSELHRPVFDYAHGEVGFLYGHSTGKFARDFESGYINGTVGNDHMQISAGAAYENLSGGRGHFGR